MNTRTNQKATKKSTTQPDLEMSEELPDSTEIMKILKRMELTINSMAKQQTEMDRKLEALASKIDAHDNLIKDLQQSANYLSGDISSIADQSQEMSKTIDEQQALLKDYSSRIITLQEEINDCQRYSRGFNLRFVGLPEESHPEKEDCIRKVQDLIESRLKIQVQIENAHRVGRVRAEISAPRHIIVKFLRRPERHAVILQRYCFKDDHVKIFEDLIPKDQQARKNLYGAAQEARSQGKLTKFVKDFLIIDGRKYTP